MVEQRPKKRRPVRFESLADVLVEIDRIQAADQNGTLHTTGNWTPGQNLSHIAAWIEYGYEGYPVPAPPWPIRWLLRIMLSRILSRGMSSGLRIRGLTEGTVGQDDMPLQAAAERLRTACLRLQCDTACPFDSPAFGPMSHEDRIRLNLRHAELHLSYLNY